ncbi:MAG TPA: right-handed parallel beta-helix repeat-containing protein [Kofleriaceae bacterium]
MAAAASGDSIAVLEGDYADNVAVSKSITLLGGFAGTFATRDPAGHVTTIRPTSAGPMNAPIIGLSSGSLVLDGLSLVEGQNNDHGGGVRVDGGTARIQNCVIARNNAFFTGGGIYIHGGASVTLIGTRIEDNTVGGQDNCAGAGITVESSTVTLRDSTIQRNRILQNMGSGGGMVLVDSVATLTNNQIQNNHAADQGQVGSGGGIATFRSQVTINGGTISHNDVGNTTGTGAGLDLIGGSVRLDGVTITSNATGALAGGGAGAIHAAGTKLILTSSVIASNIGNAGAIVADPQGSTAIVNCTIADNTARGILASSTLTLVNSVLLRNGVGLELSQSPQTIIQQNAFFGNTTNAVGTTLPASNLTVDPRIDGTLHLMADSPLIDTGMAGPISTPDTTAPPVDPPSKDIDGDPRVVMGKTSLLPDIGADEYRPMR